MPIYDNSNGRYNSDELDPCLAAEVRIKNDLLDIRQSKCLLCFILTLLTLMLLVAAFVMLFYGVPMAGSSGSRIQFVNEAGVPASDARAEAILPPAIVQQDPMKKLKTKVRDKTTWKNSDNVHSPWLMPNTIAASEASSVKPSTQSSTTDSTPITTVSSTLPVTTTKSTTTATTTTTTTPPLSTTTFYNVYVTVTNSSTVQQETTLPPTKNVDSGVMDTSTYSVRDHSLMEMITIMGESFAMNPGYQFISTSETKEHCDLYLQDGHTASGVYNLFVQGVGDFSALCIMSAGDAWTVLQRRTGSEVPFWNATFEEYANGFGDPRRDHWLGLEKVYALIHRNYNLQLRIILQGDLCVAKTKCGGLGEQGYWWGDWEFAISSRADLYKLTTLKYLRGNLSDPNTDYFNMLNKGQSFTTIDSDNDANEKRNVAAYLKKGGWWHKDFSFVALNGEYGFKSSAGVGQSWYWSNGKGKTYYIKPKASIMMFRLKK